jgi:uncharacterized metal-binding protein YceD (DUF177 family)
VEDSFFEQFEGSEISKGNLSVDILLNRLSNMLELDFDIEGEVEVLCDRCLDPFTIPTSYEGKLLVRISDSISEDEKVDDVWYVNSNEHELDLAQYIYESICLSLPIQRYHGILNTSQNECDSSMLEKLNQLSNSSNEAENYDKRWDKLKDIQNN